MNRAEQLSFNNSTHELSTLMKRDYENHKETVHDNMYRTRVSSRRRCGSVPAAVEPLGL